MTNDKVSRSVRDKVTSVKRTDIKTDHTTVSITIHITGKNQHMDDEEKKRYHHMRLPMKTYPSRRKKDWDRFVIELVAVYKKYGGQQNMKTVHTAINTALVCQFALQRKDVLKHDENVLQAKKCQKLLQKISALTNKRAAYLYWNSTGTKPPLVQRTTHKIQEVPHIVEKINQHIKGAMNELKQTSQNTRDLDGQQLDIDLPKALRQASTELQRAKEEQRRTEQQHDTDYYNLCKKKHKGLNEQIQSWKRTTAHGTERVFGIQAQKEYLKEQKHAAQKILSTDSIDTQWVKQTMAKGNSMDTNVRKNAEKLNYGQKIALGLLERTQEGTPDIKHELAVHGKITPELIHTALQRHQKNTTSAGIDEIPIQAFKHIFGIYQTSAGREHDEIESTIQQEIQEAQETIQDILHRIAEDLNGLVHLLKSSRPHTPINTQEFNRS